MLAKSGNAVAATVTDLDIEEIVTDIKVLHRQRRDFHKAEKSLTLQIKAICRRYCAHLHDPGSDKTKALAAIKKDGDALYKAVSGKGEHEFKFEASVHCEPFFLARKQMENNRKIVEKKMQSLAKELPVYRWVESINGLGALGLALLVGECGNFANYSNVGKLYMRLGLGTIDGGRQRKVSGDAALRHRYNPERRAVSWTIADSLMKKRNEYKAIYDARKLLEIERSPDITKGYAHNKAKRYAEKKMIRDLWEAWQ